MTITGALLPMTQIRKRIPIDFLQAILAGILLGVAKLQTGHTIFPSKVSPTNMSYARI